MKKVVIATMIATFGILAIAPAASAGGPLKITPAQAAKLKLPLKPVPPPVKPLPPASPKNNGIDQGMLALGVGVAMLGIVAASQQAHAMPVDDGCWYEKEVRYHHNGKPYLKKVLVCE